MNAKELQIDAINNRIHALTRANEMMHENWGTYTNESGFKFCESELAKKLTGKDYVCPFASPINGMIKPLLMELYIQMNESMIESLKYQLKVLGNVQTKSDQS
ncbi:hypothetical protein CPT_Merlin287 [Citrobacter phage Merlin]|uniref:Anti-restriction nuclease n=1 Tax=Citrobacter phage Merlin TaxID=1675602 RepID=A0A0K1LP31_9CAUD|nr:hypothetical protein CPT_Merlin287 [Citrobacter phage Merlin]AKU43933.1 hypothetical protein CPT_Merlin287 [Citrobacter phage Merlin]